MVTQLVTQRPALYEVILGAAQQLGVGSSVALALWEIHSAAYLARH